ncbi:MAG TPA: hypothetical protein V6C81_17485 [Planktothrix sp.]
MKKQSFIDRGIKSYWNECPNQDSKDMEHIPEHCLVCGKEMSWRTVLGETAIQDVRYCTNENCKENRNK